MLELNRSHRSRSGRLAAAAVFILLTILAVLSSSSVQPAHALVGPSTVAPTQEVRWIVGIKGNCTGSLISPAHVLTAAHCVDGRFRPPEVHIGWHNFRDPSDSRADDLTRGVAQVLLHPNYKSGIRQYDVAILRLTQPVTDREPVRVGAPGIAFDYDGVGEPWTDLTLYGYGKQTDNGGASPVPRKLETKLRDHAFMESVWNTPKFFNYARSRHLGAGGNLGRGPEGACNADSGGPMIGSGAQYRTRTRGEQVHADYTGPILMAVFSAYLGSCGQNPGLYMRLDQGELLDWVVEAVEEPLYCGNQIRFGSRDQWKISAATNQASCSSP